MMILFPLLCEHAICIYVYMWFKIRTIEPVHVESNKQVQSSTLSDHTMSPNNIDHLDDDVVVDADLAIEDDAVIDLDLDDDAAVDADIDLDLDDDAVVGLDLDLDDDAAIDLDNFHPMNIYSMDDFIAEATFLDECSEQIILRLKENITSEPPRRLRQSGTRRYIPRNREAGNADLVANYFFESPIYTDEMFRRRFRMRKPLFLRIVSALSEWSPYFTNRVDATGRAGHSPLQKCTAAIHMLAYGTPVDQLDEVLKIGPSIALECLGKFAKGVIEIFSEEYLRAPRNDEVERLLQVAESRGFPGMLGSIDCMHWA